MKFKIITFNVIILVITIISCTGSSQGPTQADKDAIMALHKAQRDYHFNKDSVAFSKLLAFEDFIGINGGVISRPTKQETMTKHHRYFSSVEFLNWDDVSEPVIRFSEDGSLAYTVVDKMVVLRPKDQPEASPDTTFYAWTAIYRKHPEGWKIECVTSTNK